MRRGARESPTILGGYGAEMVKFALIVTEAAGSKNCGLIAKIAGTTRPLVFTLGTVLLILGPLKASVAEENESSVEFEPAKTQRPLASVDPPTVGSPGVLLVSVPLASVADRAPG